MAKYKINQSLKNPKIIPWLGNTNFFQFKKHSFKNFSHVIYAHSFTDDQLNGVMMNLLICVNG